MLLVGLKANFMKRLGDNKKTRGVGLEPALLYVILLVIITGGLKV